MLRGKIHIRTSSAHSINPPTGVPRMVAGLCVCLVRPGERAPVPARPSSIAIRWRSTRAGTEARTTVALHADDRLSSVTGNCHAEARTIFRTEMAATGSQ
jgi:hypothetical protein